MAKKDKATIDTSGYEYKTLRVRGKDGKIHHSRGNADAVAKAMLLHLAAGGTIDQVVKANKLEVSTDAPNAGLVRMTVGGVLRAKIRNDEPVKIGAIVVKSLRQHVDLPAVEAKAAKPARKAADKRKTTAKPRRRKAVEAEAGAGAESEQVAA